MMYRDVEFLVISHEPKVYRYSGEVISRPNEMVLDIANPPHSNYLIKGILNSGFFNGNRIVRQNENPVAAKWILLGDIYIGTWIEEGIDYIFRFKLLSDEIE
jgi:hypothetical protein